MKNYNPLTHGYVMYIDTHLDTLWQSLGKRKFSKRSEDGHVDLPRAREGGLLLGFFTGFPTESQYVTEKMMSKWIEFFNEPVNQFQRIHSKREYIEFKENWDSSPANRKIGATLHFEGSAGIDSELNRLYIYHEIGLRSMSLTWNEQNQFATGVKGEKDRGITKEGKDLLDAMESLGIIVDVSHLNDKSFWDVSKHYSGPLIASHSNVRTIAEHPRNLKEEMVSAIVDSEGTIGINFCNGFLSANQEEHPANRFCAITMIEKIITLGSTKNVHIGSDFDGCQIPDDVKDITGIPFFFKDLKQKLNLNDGDIENISHLNMERIIKAIWH